MKKKVRGKKVIRGRRTKYHHSFVISPDWFIRTNLEWHPPERYCPSVLSHLFSRPSRRFGEASGETTRNNNKNNNAHKEMLLLTIIKPWTDTDWTRLFVGIVEQHIVPFIKSLATSDMTYSSFGQGALRQLPAHASEPMRPVSNYTLPPELRSERKTLVGSKHTGMEVYKVAKVSVVWCSASSFMLTFSLITFLLEW
jgi:hypothetical protein